MKKRESVERFDLVSLKMADEVPADWLSDLTHLRERFLNSILADVSDSSGPSRLNSFRTVGLCDGDNRDALAMPSPLDCSVDSLANRCPLPPTLARDRETSSVL